MSRTASKRPNRHRRNDVNKSDVPVGRAPTISRCGWSGILQLGPLSIPVKGYPAAVQHDSLLHFVHADCGCRIQQIKQCPQHGALSADQIAKSFLLPSGGQVILSKKDLVRLRPFDDQTIHIEHLMPEAQMEWWHLSGRTLFLTPAHSLAEASYAQAATVLAQAAECGIGHVALSETQQLVAIRAVNGAILLHTLHWPAQWRAFPRERMPQSRTAVPESILDSLHNALSNLRQWFDWQRLRDDAEVRLSKLINEKTTSEHTNADEEIEHAGSEPENRAA